MPYQTGRLCKAYYDPSGVGGSSWIELGDVEVAEQTNGKNVATVKNRKSKFEKGLAGQHQMTGTLRLTYDKAATWFADFMAAFENDTIIGLALMDGDITVAGTTGIQLDALITSFSPPQELDEAMNIPCEFQPHALSSVEPDIVKVTS